MTVRRAAVARTTIGLLVVIVVPAASLAFAATTPRSVARTVTATSTETSTIVSLRTSTVTTTSTDTKVLTVGDRASSNLSANGLRLRASINGTDIIVGEGLNVSLSVSNTLSISNTVRTSNDDWRFVGVPVYLWPPCDFPFSVKVVVLQGNYTVQELNATTANVNFRYVCAEAVTLDHVVFQPNSDVVNTTGVYGITDTNGTQGPFRLAFHFTALGYWDLQGLSDQLNPPSLGNDYAPNAPSFTRFVPGVYTAAAEDEWGQTVVLHFNVISP